MPRRPRTESPGGIHHVWQRGNNRRQLFIDDRDHRLFLRLLADTAQKRTWCCLAYCLMRNHFHLVVETPERTLGLGMRDLGSQFAQAFNERYETGGGYVFQGRYGSRLVKTDEQLAQLLRYVGRNPVAAGLCARPELWQWSSHANLLDHRPHPLVAVERVDRLLEPFGGPPRTRYARLFDPDGPLRHIDPDLSPWSIRPSLEEILRDADLSAAIRRARRHGYRLADLASATGLSVSTLSRHARKGSVPL